jgi:hypothetical protein
VPEFPTGNYFEYLGNTMTVPAAMVAMMSFCLIEFVAVVTQIVLVHSHFPLVTESLVPVMGYFPAVAVQFAAVFITLMKLSL